MPKQLLSFLAIVLCLMFSLILTVWAVVDLVSISLFSHWTYEDAGRTAILFAGGFLLFSLFSFGSDLYDEHEGWR